MDTKTRATDSVVHFLSVTLKYNKILSSGEHPEYYNDVDILFYKPEFSAEINCTLFTALNQIK